MADLVIVGATILDTASAEPELAERTIVVEDGRIAALRAPDAAVEESAEELDAEGLWAIPGLIDLGFDPYAGATVRAGSPAGATAAYRVYRALGNLDRWAQTGVTTAVTIGREEQLDLDLRAMSGGDEVRGPRILAGGTPIAAVAAARGDGMEAFRRVRDATDARRAAREQIKAGADHLRVWADLGVSGWFLAGWLDGLRLSAEEIRAVVEECDHAGIACSAYAADATAISTALDAGVAWIEPLEPVAAPVVSAMAGNGAAMVPMGLDGVSSLNGEHRGRAILSAGRAAVPLAAASAGQATLREVCFALVDAGLNSYETLRAVTTHAASALKRGQDLGGLLPGHRADLLFLEANPVEDIRNLSRVRGVVRSGRTVFWRE